MCMAKGNVLIVMEVGFDFYFELEAIEKWWL